MQKSFKSEELSPTIVALQEHLEKVRQTELNRIRRRQLNFRSEQQDAIEELTRGIVTRILHWPVKVLGAASDDEKLQALLSIVHRIFDLGNEPARTTND
jgi:glutamyl-tRNA reductase